MVLGWRYSVEWGNPYTNPPEGQPRVLVEWFETTAHREQRRLAGDGNIPQQVAEAHVPGSGYMVCVSTIAPPPRQKEKEQLATLRRKRLEKRMTEKHPLFAEQFIQEELQKRGWYYDGEEDPRYAEARQLVIQGQVEMYRRFYRFVLEHEGEEAAEEIRRAAEWAFDAEDTREGLPAGGARVSRVAGLALLPHME